MNDRRPSGPISWFAGHHVAANLLMIFIVGVGLLSLASVVIEVFPELDIDTVSISVVYPGASPSETEEGVVVRIEEAIASVEGIDRITASAAEGAGAVSAELKDGADDQKVLDDIKAAIDRIDTFPEETEEPLITEITSRREVVSVVVYGDASQKTLAALADRIRDDLTATEEISQADVQGVPPYEISIEVSEEKLRAYGLTFSQVADAVRGASLDLPGGAVKTRGGEILLRTLGQKYTGPEFEGIELLTRGDGTQVLVGDVARVVDGFEDADVTTRFDGLPAALVQVYRTGDEGALEIAEEVERYVAESTSFLPEGIELATWQDRSVVLKQRISLLIENARLGLFLVFLCLALFLDLRLAFWTTLGIPISFLGGLWLAPAMDVTINMISLFAFIVALGIVVDDAIVVGENIYSHLQRGEEPLRAAIAGAREMTGPVTFAVLTSVAAFLPLVFVEGVIGKVMRTIPLVVIAVLLTSLVESLLILPAHLAGGEMPRFLRAIARFFAPLLNAHELLRRWVTRGLHWVIREPYRRTLEVALEWRYLTVTLAIVILAVSGGGLAAGFVKFTFMPTVDADVMNAYLEMPQGTPVEETRRVAQHIEDAAFALSEEVTAELGLESALLVHVNTTLGEQPSTGGSGPISLGAITGSGGHLAEVTVELLAGEERGIASSELLNRWREKVGEVAGVTSLVFRSNLFMIGDPVSVQLAHRDFDTLLEAADRLKENLEDYPGVKDITDSFVPGKRELKVDVTDEGRALGFTRQRLARQVRQGFYGEEAQRIQRGRDEIKVMVRYPEDERESLGDIEAMRIRLADGTEVPFGTVATSELGRGYATLRRVDRRRVVTVSADVDTTVVNANEINAELEATVLPALARTYPGLTYDFEGEQREQQKSIASLAKNFAVALLIIFSLLAIPFRSYSQPLIVMSVIPFGLVGAIGGHVVMGMGMSMLSVFGMVALTGVVVNDSLILIDLINRMRRAGATLDEAIRTAGQKRFRPIILTTLTTFFGLSPMILETSLQAQFLIPMAISLGFGVVFATAITLILVPTIYRILEDLHFVFDSTSVEVPEDADADEDPKAAPGSAAPEPSPA